jgi:hypothetical protein
LPSEIRHTLDNERIKLAAMEIPPNVDRAVQTSIKQAIDECFTRGFHRVSLVGAVLALASSLAAGLVIRSRNAT